MIDLPASDPHRDGCADIRQTPMLRPHVIALPVPTLAYVDERGRHVALTLDDRGLAALALSIAEAQAARARSHLASLQSGDL